MADNVSRRQGLAPETDNAEQDRDADDQAQTVAEQARTRGTLSGLSETEKIKSGDPSDDVQDLVERMEQMESSGRIDMDAYRGEPNHDDNVDELGPKSKIDKLRGDGS